MLDRHWVIIDTSEHTIRCTRCGERIPMPVGPVRFVIAVGRAFAKEHGYCGYKASGRQPGCAFVTPITSRCLVCGRPADADVAFISSKDGGTFTGKTGPTVSADSSLPTATQHASPQDCGETPTQPQP